MVKEVKGWQTENGELFTTEHEAILAETQTMIFGFLIANGCNEAQARNLSRMVAEFRGVMEPLVIYHYKQENSKK
jgi:hypothetical protein